MQKYGYHYQPPARNNKSKIGRVARSILLFTTVFVFIALSYSIYKVIKDNLIQKVVISPVGTSVSSSIATARNILFPDKLEEIVKKSLKGTPGTYAVAIKNLKTGEAFYMNEDRVFEAASLYKLWVMALSYKLIESGKLDPDKKFDKDITELNETFDIATESAELTEGTFTLEVKNALRQMITISHNYSALALTQELGVARLSKFVKENGFINSKVQNPPLTTARDIEYFYEKLYSGQLGNKKTTSAMLSLLKSQQINDRLPRYLPRSVSVAHKTGELDYVKHDAGIVFAPKGPYIIVVMSESKDPDEAVEQEALLSKAVYQYFENK